MHSTSNLTDPSDLNERALLSQAVNGDRAALEELIRRHQEWIYNIALRMVWYPPDAEDVTQEILVKMITNLGTFRGESSVRTWLYRILVNHVIKMKKRIAERNWFVRSFDDYGRSLDEIPDGDLIKPGGTSVDEEVVVAETRLKCKMGMLLCLNRELRLAFILGAIFALSPEDAGEILGITNANYRQRISRARKKIRHFMEGRCELIDESNPCKCHRKTKALIELGNIDPHALLFGKPNLRTVERTIRMKSDGMGIFGDDRCDRLFRNDPFQKSPDFASSLKSIVDDSFYGRFN